MNEIINSLMEKNEEGSREITEQYIFNNIQVLISPLLYLLDSGITGISPEDELEYDFYNFTDTDGYVARLSETLIPEYTQYKGNVDENGGKHVSFRAKINQNIGNPGANLYGVYDEFVENISYTFSWFDVSEDGSILPKSLFCREDGKCYAVIDHGTSYNIVCGNRECYIRLEDLTSQEKKEIEDLLLQCYDVLCSKINISAIRRVRAAIPSNGQDTPYSIRFDCSFVEKTIWEHNVDPPLPDTEGDN